MIKLSTHVLDTSQGKPVSGVAVRLFAGENEIASHTTDEDGRCANLLPNPIEPGVYRIVFEMARYFPEGLYPEVVIVFKVRKGIEHYHIPLLMSPFGYTTYRGS